MKTQTSFIRQLLLGLVAVGLVGCGKGFDAGSSSSSDGGGNGSLGTPEQQQKAWSDVSNAVDGQVASGNYTGRLAVQIDKNRQALILVVPLPPVFLLPVTNMTIPELPGASVEMITQSDGSSALGVVIPLKYVIKGAQFADYGKLPNGDNIPFIPVGEARGFAISFPQKPSYRLHLYMSVNAAAVFIETPDFPLPIGGGYQVKNKAKTQVVGYLGLVPTKGAYSSGVYVASRIPTEVAIVIDELLRY